jgi:hypothetical protein
MTTPKQCSRNGCACPSRARGMCKNHYEQWRRALPVPLRENTSNPEILGAMPGTIAEIAALCGMKYDTVRKAVKRLHAKGESHIGDVRPPEGGKGQRWVDVFAAGPGEDVKATKARKRKYALARVCARYAVRKLTGKIDPLLAALFSRSCGDSSALGV